MERIPQYDVLLRQPPTTSKHWGGGELIRCNWCRSSIIALSLSPSVSTIAPIVTTEELDSEKECSGLAEENEEVEEEELPFWIHFYSLDALQSIICQRLISVPLTQQHQQQHQHQQYRQSHGRYSRPPLEFKQLRASKRKARRLSRMTMSRRISTFGSPLNSSSSMSISSTSMQLLMQSRKTLTTLSPRRKRARTARRHVSPIKSDFYPFSFSLTNMILITCSIQLNCPFQHHRLFLFIQSILFPFPTSKINTIGCKLWDFLTTAITTTSSFSNTRKYQHSSILYSFF